MIVAIGSVLWGFIGPWIGPLVAVVLPGLARWRSRLPDIGGWIAPAIGAVIVCATVVLTVWVARERRAELRAEGARECELASMAAAHAAENAALRSALAERQRRIEAQEREAQDSAAVIEGLIRNKKAIRDDAENRVGDDDVVFGVGDGWLRQERGAAAKLDGKAGRR